MKHLEDKDPSKLEVSWKIPETLNGVLKTFRIQRNDSEEQTFPADQFSFVDEDLMVCYFKSSDNVLIIEQLNQQIHKAFVELLFDFRP